MSITRRKFIVGSAALAAFAAFASATNGSVQALFQAKNSVSRGKRVPLYTACHQCDQQCAVIAYVEDGVLVKLDGNPVDQKSRGALCPKGQAGILELYNPYRIKRPMVRTNPEKGFEVDPKWKEVSWEEALDLMSGKLGGIVEKYGARSIAGDDVGYIGSFFRALGSPNTFRCGNTCYYAPMSTQLAVLGEPFHNSDLIAGVTKYAIMFSNSAETVENPFGGQVGQAKAGGAKIVAFDPRLSTTAAKADEWIPIKPGTDLAALLAMMNVIITENLHDRKFVDDYTYGFDKLSDFSKQYTPEWAEKITDVPAETLRRIARELATTKPSVVSIRRGPSKHRKGSYRIYHAWAILNALIGSIDVRGTTIADRAATLGAGLASPKSPPAPYGECIDSREKLLPTPGKVWDGRIMEAGTQDSFADSVLNGPYPVKATIFAGANPIHSSANRDKWVEALRACFVAVVDYQMTDTAWLADVILPCPTYLERDAVLKGELYSPQPQVYCRQKVVEPLYDTKEEPVIWHELGRRMGIEDYLPPVGVNVLDASCAGALDANQTPLGITFEELKRRGVIVINKPFEPTRKFNTPTGKIELYSKRFEEAGFDPMPTWRGPSMEPSDEYPFYFVSYNDAAKYMSMHAWNPWLEELMDSTVWINTETAKKARIANGDAIFLESRSGRVKAKAKVTEGIRPDTVAMAHGRGFQNPMTSACARVGANANAMTNAATRAGHIEWYNKKEEPFGIARFLDFTVKMYKAEGS